MSNVEYKPAEKLQIQLVRPDASVSWGFRLQGGIDFQTPLSIQSVNPNGTADACGLCAGDAILAINNQTSDAMTHDEAKAVIMASGNQIIMLVERGAVKIWKPAVTPLNELRPAELKPIVAATGEEFVPTQKTSLVANKPPDMVYYKGKLVPLMEISSIGSSHNRSAKPFGAAFGAPPAAASPPPAVSPAPVAAPAQVAPVVAPPVPRAPPAPRQPSKIAVPNVVHAQYNSPMGLYSAGNIADSYSQQTEGIQKQMEGLDIAKKQIGSKMNITGQSIDPEAMGQSPFGANFQQSDPTAPGFRSVSAPIAKPPSDKPKEPAMKCGGCGFLPRR